MTYKEFLALPEDDRQRIKDKIINLYLELKRLEAKHKGNDLESLDYEAWIDLLESAQPTTKNKIRSRDE